MQFCMLGCCASILNSSQLVSILLFRLRASLVRMHLDHTRSHGEIMRIFLKNQVQVHHNDVHTCTQQRQDYSNVGQSVLCQKAEVEINGPNLKAHFY